MFKFFEKKKLICVRIVDGIVHKIRRVKLRNVVLTILT